MWVVLDLLAALKAAVLAPNSRPDLRVTPARSEKQIQIKTVEVRTGHEAAGRSP